MLKNHHIKTLLPLNAITLAIKLPCLNFGRISLNYNRFSEKEPLKIKFIWGEITLQWEHTCCCKLSLVKVLQGKRSFKVRKITLVILKQ